jgi:hypothetical protein
MLYRAKMVRELRLYIKAEERVLDKYYGGFQIKLPDYQTGSICNRFILA